MGAVHHFQNFVIIDTVLKVFGNALEFFKVNNSVIILIEKSENSLDSVLGLDFTNLAGSNINELLESDGFALFFKTIDDPQDVRASSVDSQFLKNLIDFRWVDGATAILIKDFEGLLELVVVFRGESVFPLSGDGFGNLS